MEARCGVERRIIRPAPDLTAGDLVSLSEAWQMLGVRSATLLNQVNDGRFTVVWHLGRERAEAGSARMLLRAEVEEYAASRRTPGGQSFRVAPEVDGVSPSLEGVEYGIEERVVVAAPHVTGNQVMWQKEAAEMLGVTGSTVLRQMNRGRFTIVWDLTREGVGARSARMLLRAEVEEAAAGGRQMSRASYRMPPVS